MKGKDWRERKAAGGKTIFYGAYSEGRKEGRQKRGPAGRTDRWRWGNKYYDLWYYLCMEMIFIEPDFGSGVSCFLS